MPDCIFCKIVKKELPSYTVYEDDHFLAFLDIHPQSPGHVLVIPKEHHRWVWGVPRLGDYFEVVGKIARAQQKAFDQEMILSKIVGEDVFHAHIWVFPSDRTKGDKMDFEGNKKKILGALQG